MPINIQQLFKEARKLKEQKRCTFTELEIWYQFSHLCLLNSCTYIQSAECHIRNL